MSKNNSLISTETDWERLDHMDDDDIDTSDIPELTTEDFAHLKLTRQSRLFNPTQPYTITEHQADGTSVSYEMPPLQKRVVVLDVDVSRYFPDSEAVNRTLRSLIQLIPTQQ